MVDFSMIKIEGGSFMMGSSDEGDHALPIHKVSVDSFYLGENPVTQQEYKFVTGSNPSHFRVYKHPEQAKEYLSSCDIGEIDFSHPVLSLEPRPVETVSWFEAIVFCNRLSLLKGFTPCYKIRNTSNPDFWGQIPHRDREHVNIAEDYRTWNRVQCDFRADGYRLPTEAEWEYAARGGVNHDPFIYSGGDVIYEISSYMGGGFIGADPQTESVKMHRPNSLGLYDMSGNVWEWCWDWAGRYPSADQINPCGPNWGTGRVARGGGYAGSMRFCKVSCRGGNVPEFKKTHSFGFRLCRSC